jgi:hypothetical protein
MEWNNECTKTFLKEWNSLNVLKIIKGKKVLMMMSLPKVKGAAVHHLTSELPEGVRQLLLHFQREFQDGG